MYFPNFFRNPNIWSKNQTKNAVNPFLNMLFCQFTIPIHPQHEGNYKKASDDAVVQRKNHLKHEKCGNRPKQPVLHKFEDFPMGEPPSGNENKVVNEHQQHTPEKGSSYIPELPLYHLHQRNRRLSIPPAVFAFWDS